MSTRRDWWLWFLGLVTGAALASYVTLSCATGRAQSVPQLIDQAASEWGIPWAAGHLKRISWCESRWFPGAFNRSSGASGLFQFVPRTWGYASWAAGVGGASVFDAWANTTAAVWLYRTEGPRHWVCR